MCVHRKHESEGEKERKEPNEKGPIRFNVTQRVIYVNEIGGCRLTVPAFVPLDRIQRLAVQVVLAAKNCIGTALNVAGHCHVGDN